MHSSSDKHQSKVERFLKLGYSRADIVRVLDSLRHDAQTNDILGELIKTGGHQASSTSTSNSTNAPATTSATPTPTAARHTGAHNGLPGGSAKSSRPPSSSSSSSSPQLVARGCGSPRAVSPSQSPAAPVDRNHASNFRPVVIDGSNVAMSHGNKQVFSCRGVQLAVKWFWDRGLRDITVFVPLWRKEQPRPETPITDQHILTELERKKILVFTPSRCVGGKRIVCYDDRYIVELAFASDGIIVSNDNYRDLQIEKPQWKKFIEDRLLMYTFANDTFMPPEDPLGRNGPTLDNFLRKSPTVPENKQPPCPYGKKCTYGVKCKYSHPERADQSQLSVADELRAKSRSAIEENQALHHQVPPTAYPALHPYPLGPSGTGLAGHSHGGRYSMLPHCVVGQETDGCSPALRPCSPRAANGSYTPSTGPDSGLSFGSDPWMPDVPPHHFHPYHQLEVPPRSAGSIATSSGVAGLSDLYSSASSSGRLDMDESLDHTHNTGLGHSRSERRYPHVTSESHVIGGQGYPAAPGVSKGHRCGPSYPFHMHMPPLAHDGRCHSYDFVDHRPANPHCQQQYRPSRSMDEFWRPVSSPSPSDKRQVAKAHLSAIFPPDSVDHVMRLYPHVNDTTELVALMRKLKTTF